MATAVYDPEEQKESAPKADDLKNAENGDGGGGLFRDDSSPDRGDSESGSSGKDKSSKEDLSKAEKSSGLSGSDGGLFKDDESQDKTSKGSKSGFRGLISRNKKKSGLFGIIAMFLSSVAIMGFLLSGPLKIESMVANLQKKFFSTSEDAVEKANEKMLKRYIIKYVLPSYRNCGTTISKKCSVSGVNKSNNPVNNMYRAWANARIENKLADKYGIEIIREKGTWRVKAPVAGASAKGIDIGSNGEKIDDLFNKANRAQVRAVIREANAKETRWKKVMFRYKVGRLLETKYGIKRCIIFCGTRDALADKVDEKKLAAKIYLVDRVITPRNESLGIVLTCLMSDCDAKKTKPSDTGDAPALKGAPENDEVDKATREALTSYAQQLGFKNADELIGKYKEISEKGFQKYLVEVALKNIIGDVAAKRVSNVIPVAGWINLASQVVNAANNAGPNLRKLRYVTNAAPMVATYMMYRSYADEIHTHKVDPTEVGSMVKSLGSGDVDNKTDPIKGGSASAENSPLYASIMGGTIANSGSISNLFFGKSSAEAAIDYKKTVTSDAYKCNSGKTPPEGKLVCPEEELGGGNDMANAIHDALNTPALKGVVILAQAWKSTVGILFKFIDNITGDAFKLIAKGLDLTCGLPAPFKSGYCTAKDLAEQYAPDVVEAVTTLLIPNPFSSNMSGGRTFNMMAGGADVSGNDYAHTGLGGKALTDQEVADIRNEQMTEDRLAFQNKSVFSRMFDTENSNSAVSQLAMAVPFDLKSTLPTRLMSLVANPIKSFSSFVNGLSFRPAFAAEKPSKDPFGVTQYGYPSGSIPDDLEKYWDDMCKDDPSQAYQNDTNYQNSNWNQAAADNVDKDTGMPKNEKTNVCMLIKDTVGSSAGAYDTDLLTEDDLKVQGSGSGTDSSSTTEISGDAQELAKKIIDSGNVTGDSRYMQQIKDVANGKTGCNVNPDILKMLVGVAVNDNHKLYISSLNRKCTGVITPGSGTASYHYSDGGGHAIDVTSFDGETVNGGNTATKKYLEEASKYLPEGTGYGQVNKCGSGFKVPDGSTTFDDSCDHQHIQVPKKQMSDS